MRRWPAILGALAAILVPGILIAQMHTNPAPGDVWTYFGPTLGGGWGAPSGGGTGSPGGTTGQIQWNNAGSFAGVTVGGDFTINTTTGNGTIVNNAVTTSKIIDGAVTNAKLATPSITIAGITFNLGGSVTSASLTAALGPCSTTLQGTVPASGGGTTSFLRADCTWAAPPGGGGGSVSVTSLTPDIQVSPSPGVGTFTIGKYGGTTIVGDANCGTLTNATGAVLFNVPFTAARSCTLPAASTMQTWQEICFNDVSNGTAYAINGANTLTINRAGSDKIETATSAVMGVGGAKLCFKAVSSSAWAQTQNTNLGAQAATSNNFLTGLNSDGVFTRAQPSVSNLSGFGTGVATALGVNVGSAGAPVLFNGAGGTPSSMTLTSATGLPISTGVSGLGTSVATAAAANLSANGGLTKTVFSGAKAMATSAIASGACTSAQTDTATGTLTTDVVSASFNGDPTAITGFIPATAGMLTIIVYPTADTVNFKECNNTSASITPGAHTINWRVTR